jgi:hypothetical protein
MLVRTHAEHAAGNKDHVRNRGLTIDACAAKRPILTATQIVTSHAAPRRSRLAVASVFIWPRLISRSGSLDARKLHLCYIEGENELAFCDDDSAMRKNDNKIQRQGICTAPSDYPTTVRTFPRQSSSHRGNPEQKGRFA